MKEITECIGDIGWANSTIFTMLDLTSGFWQMQLDEDSQKLTAFTIPGKGQFHWITSPMGLLVPSKFPTLNGRSIERHSQCTGVHRRSTGAHGHPWKTLTSAGPSTGMAALESSQNQPGEMRIRKQGSLIPGLHSHSRWNQTRQKQTQGYQGCQTTHRYQNNSLVCGFVQLLQDAHQGFCPNCSTVIQTHEKGLRVLIRATSGESSEGFLHPTKATHLRTGHGLS